MCPAFTRSCGVAALVLAMTGCVTATSVRRWRPRDAAGVVTATICIMCTAPYDYQVRAALELAQEKCGNRRVSVVEEGASATGNSYAMASAFTESGGHGGASSTSYAAGSSVAEREYYWAFRCE